jgi:hypothetical protein
MVCASKDACRHPKHKVNLANAVILVFATKSIQSLITAKRVKKPAGVICPSLSCLNNACKSSVVRAAMGNFASAFTSLLAGLLLLL